MQELTPLKEGMHSKEGDRDGVHGEADSGEAAMDPDRAPDV